MANVSTLLMSVGQPHRPFSAGIGRPRPGDAALALDGRHQGGLLAADEGPGPDADVHAEVERRLEHAAAEHAEFLGLLNRLLQSADGQRVLAADVEKPCVAPTA